MDYFLEVWLRDGSSEYIKDLSKNYSENFHPHITLVRPFNIKSSEKEVKNKIISLCKGKKPFSFLMGKNEKFSQGLNYLLIEEEKELLHFSNNIETAIISDVEFSKKLGNKKLHVTIGGTPVFYFENKIQDYMIRLTAIRKKRIWFSYDFVIQKVLDRKESLDKVLWENSVFRLSHIQNLNKP